MVNGDTQFADAEQDGDEVVENGTTHEEHDDTMH